jgi:hypothetical protein
MKTTEAPSAHNTPAMLAQQSPQVHERATTKASSLNQGPDTDVLMAKEQEDNDGFDLVGSLFKVYPKPKTA